MGSSFCDVSLVTILIHGVAGGGITAPPGLGQNDSMPDLQSNITSRLGLETPSDRWSVDLLGPWFAYAERISMLPTESICTNDAKSREGTCRWRRTERLDALGSVGWRPT